MARIEVIQREIFKFDELNSEAQQKAIDDNREINVNFDGWFHEDDVREAAKIIGFDIKEIYWSGFYSQGDGACFEGTYEYNAGSYAKIKEYAPNDKELHEIVAKINNLQRKNFYKLTANIKHSGFYYHSGCTEFAIRRNGEDFFDTRDSIVCNNSENGAQLVVLIREFMDWIYEQIKHEYEYLTSDDGVKEYLSENDFEFLENGTMV